MTHPDTAHQAANPYLDQFVPGPDGLSAADHQWLDDTRLWLVRYTHDILDRIHQTIAGLHEVHEHPHDVEKIWHVDTVLRMLWHDATTTRRNLAETRQSFGAATAVQDSVKAALIDGALSAFGPLADLGEQELQVFPSRDNAPATAEFLWEHLAACVPYLEHIDAL